MGYKNVCINCRLSLSEGTNYELFNTNKTCPTCKSKMYFVNEKFKASKKSNDKEWKIYRVFVVELAMTSVILIVDKSNVFILSFLRTYKRQRRLSVRCER